MIHDQPSVSADDVDTAPGEPPDPRRESRRRFLKHAGTTLALGLGVGPALSSVLAQPGMGAAVSSSLRLRGWPDPDGPVCLDQNLGPLGPAPVVEARMVAAGRPALHVYPDRGEGLLGEAVGTAFGVPAASVLITCGSTEGISLVLGTGGEARGPILVESPVFPLLGQMARDRDLPLEAVPVLTDGHIDATRVARAARRASLCFLVSPHNPTGGRRTSTDLDAVRAALPPGALLVVDHAYIDFDEPSSAADLTIRASREPGLVVLRTFSKIHGLAGMRVGVLIATPATVQLLGRRRLIHGVGTLAAALAVVALGERAHVTSARSQTQAARDRLGSQLTAAGARALPSVAPYLSVVVPDPVVRQGVLAARGIRVLACPPDVVRVSMAPRGVIESVTADLVEVLGRT